MQQVSALAEAHHAVKVSRIVVRIGPLSGIEPRLLESAFTISRAGTLAEEAELLTEPQPILVHCNQCGVESEASINNLTCATCGAIDTKLLNGDELILASVELESPD